MWNTQQAKNQCRDCRRLLGTRFTRVNDNAQNTKSTVKTIHHVDQFSSSWPIQRSDQINEERNNASACTTLEVLSFSFSFLFFYRYCCTRVCISIFFSSFFFFLFKTYLYVYLSFCFDYPDASDWTEDVRRSRDILYTSVWYYVK